MAGLAIIGALAIGIERFQEFLLGKKLNGWLMQVLSWVLGIGICVLVKVGLFSALGLVDSVDVLRSYGDYAVTGFLIGLGANFIHDLVGGLTAGTIKD